MMQYRWARPVGLVVAVVTMGTLTGVSGAYAAPPAPLITHVAPTPTGVGMGGPSVAAFTLFVGERVELGFLTGYGFPGASYRVAENSILPKGLKLNKHTGVISGKPKLPDTVQLTTFEVLDPAGQITARVAEYFVILPAP